MIIATIDGAKTGVRQPEHARVSAEIAEACDLKRAADLEGELRRRFIDAVRHHDDGWIEWEETALRLDRPSPLMDFTEAPTAEHTAIWRRSVECGAQRHPYVGLLIAMHAQFLYERERDHAASPNERRLEQEMRTWLKSRIRGLQEARAGAAEPPRLVTPVERRLHQSWLSVFDALTLMMLEGIPRRDRIAVHDAQIEAEWNDHEVLLKGRLMRPEQLNVEFNTIDDRRIHWRLRQA